MFPKKCFGNVLISCNGSGGSLYVGHCGHLADGMRCNTSKGKHSRGRLDINFLKPTGHVMHHQFNIQQLLALPTLYLCVLYTPIYIYVYIYIGFKTFFYVVRHPDSIASYLPTGLYLGLFRSWPSLYLPIQFFFGLPRALFCFGIHFNAILGHLPSAIL